MIQAATYETRMRKIDADQTALSEGPKVLLERRASVARRMKALAETVTRERRDFDADEKTSWHGLDTLYEELSVEIAKATPSNRSGRLPGRDDVDHRASCRDGRPPTSVMMFSSVRVDDFLA